MCKFHITLAAARVNAGLSQAQAAALLHVSKGTLCRWEKENKAPYAAMMLMASTYGVPEDAFSMPKTLAKSE